MFVVSNEHVTQSSTSVVTQGDAAYHQHASAARVRDYTRSVSVASVKFSSATLTEQSM